MEIVRTILELMDSDNENVRDDVGSIRTYSDSVVRIRADKFGDRKVQVFDVERDKKVFAGRLRTVEMYEPGDWETHVENITMDMINEKQNAIEQVKNDMAEKVAASLAASGIDNIPPVEFREYSEPVSNNVLENTSIPTNEIFPVTNTTEEVNDHSENN